MVEVHHFKVRNSKTDNWDTPPCKGTAEDIGELKGELIPDTMEMVFKARLDSEVSAHEEPALEVHYGQGEAHITLSLPVPLFPTEPRGEIINGGIGQLIDGLEDWEESKKEIV
jgi:hypothetical protein